MSTTPAAAPFEPKMTGSDKFDPDKRKSDIKQLYDASRKYREENFDEELAEAYRAVKVRTEKILIEDSKGNMVEDTNRTNVCMPGLNTIVKRKTARKTANPPTLNYYVPGDDPNMLSQRLTARAYYEYDRSGEAYELKRGVNQADIFGYSYWKHFYDTVEIQQQMRYQVASLTNRRNLLKAQGAGDDQIQEAIAKQGEDVDQQELADIIAQNGPEIRGTSPFTLYEGPVTKCRFIGDIFIEPGCLTLNASSYVIEEYTETDLWLRKMAKKTYKDPESGQDVPIFDKEKVQELWDKPSVDVTQDQINNLRQLFRSTIGKAEPMVEKRLLPGKRFRIKEYHGPDKQGQMWIEYIGNDSVYLGRQPYPFDLGGKFLYTEYIPWPDIIGAIGDSSPRALRFLHAMHNANAGQIIDVVNQSLRRQYKVSSAADIPDAAGIVTRGQFTFIVMKNGDMNSVIPFAEPGVPPDAWQTNAFIKSEMRENEPSLGGVEATGSEFSTEPGKTATTAILAAKSSDVLMQSEIDALNLTIGDQANIKLQIHCQLSDRINIPNREKYTSKIQGLSERFGKTAMITIDSVPELQGQDGEFIEVEAVAGSTLAVDDELRANKIQSLYQMAAQNPAVFNQYEVAKLVLTTIKGVGDTSKVLNDPSQQKPPGPKISFSVTLPLDKAANVPEDILNQILPELGLQPSADVAHKQSIDALLHASQGADAAVNLASPAHTKDMQGEILKGQQTKVQDKVNAAP
jgi:hypothetical protein